MITGLHITDVLNGYKGFRRDVFTRYKYKSGEFEIEIELVANALKAGYQIGEFACHEKARAGGEAKSRVIRHGTRFGKYYSSPFRIASPVQRHPYPACGHLLPKGRRPTPVFFHPRRRPSPFRERMPVGRVRALGTINRMITL